MGTWRVLSYCLLARPNPELDGQRAANNLRTVKMNRPGPALPDVQHEYSSVCLDSRRCKRSSELCQNCVTWLLKPPVNLVIFEDTSMRIDVA